MKHEGGHKTNRGLTTFCNNYVVRVVVNRDDEDIILCFDTLIKFKFKFSSF